MSRPVPRGARRALTALLAAALAGCHAIDQTTVLPPTSVAQRLLLIGDAGAADPRLPEAVLASLRAEAAQLPDRTTIVFLGDNVYPAGVPRPDAYGYADAIRRLDAQIMAVPSGARAIFVPGNHDWRDAPEILPGSGLGGAEGLDAIRREGATIAQRPRAPNTRVEMLPANGCPGPAVVESERVRLVLLDTQWWLHPYLVGEGAPPNPSVNCPARGEREIIAALRTAVKPARPGQHVVVAAHHPFMTAGPHGGYCGAFTFVRRWAKTHQDILGGSYQQMTDALRDAFEHDPPLVFAAGHDHSLQVTRGRAKRYPQYLIVSGAGSAHVASCAVRLRESMFVAQETSGFVRLDFTTDGRVALTVFRAPHMEAGESATPDSVPRARTAFSTWLVPRGTR